jgi:PAS domain-containing protein
MDNQTAVTPHIHTLWQELAHELADVFDLHGICATAAAEIAAFAGCDTVLSTKDPYNSFYNVWICRADGQMEQSRWEKRVASFETVIKLGQAMWQEKYQLPPSELVQSELWRLAREKALFAPLPLDSRRAPLTPPGAICLLDPAPDCPIDLDKISSLSAYLTVFLDRALLRHRSQQQTVEFDIVSDISYSITSTLDLETIFKQVADAVRRTLNAESISIGLTDPASGEIVFVDALMGPLFHNLPPIRLQPGQGIAGWVAAHAEPLIVNNVYDDRRFFAKVDQKSGFHTHSVLCVPLRIEQRVIGVLEAINKQNGRFNDNDLGLLQAISGPLAVAIENARLHTDVLAEKRRIETLFASMSEGMLTINDQGWITAANDSLLTLLRTDRAAVLNCRAEDVIKIRQSKFSDFMATVIQQAEQE